MKLTVLVQDELNNSLKSVEDWVLAEKSENEFVLTSGSLFRSFDLTQFTEIRSIIVVSDQPVSIAVTKNSVTQTLNSEGTFVFNPSSIDVSLLETVLITSLNATDTSVKVCIYGV